MPTTTVIRRTPEGWQRRTKLDIDKLMAMEHAVARVTRKPTSISLAFDYLQERRQAGIVRVDDFVAHEQFADSGSKITTIDVDIENPWNYRFASHKGLYFGWMNGKCLAEFPLAPVVDECAIEYFECKSAGQPVAHHIQHNLNGFSRNYLRLLLPLAGADGVPKALVSVVRHLALQDPDELSQAIRRGSTMP